MNVSSKERTKRLRGLCVAAFLTTEDAETLHTTGKIFVVVPRGPNAVRPYEMRLVRTTEH